MNQSTNNSAVPAAILRKLRLVQKRSMLVQVACAFVAAAAVLLAAMGVAMLIDWLATLYDSRWRVVLTTLALAAAACTSIGWIFVAWRRSLRLDRVAADVDRQVPQLEERWTTMTRLGEDAANPGIVHPAMLRRVSSEAASWEPRIEPDSVVSLSTLMRTMLGLTAVSAVLALAVVLDSREVMVLAGRFWLPGSSISATKLVDVPGNLVIARGEPLALNATLAGRSVESAVLFLQPEAKPELSITLVAERSAPVGFSHRLRSVDEPFAYRFRAGDGQTDWFNVDVADRPEIDAMKLTVTAPAYIRQQPKTFDKLPERLSALRNSRVEFAVRPKAPIETAQLKMDNNQAATLPLGSDGWYRWTTTLSESFSITPVLTENHGLTNRRQPKCLFIAYEDQPPVVKVLAPNDRMAVRPDDSIEITFSATDDIGIGAAELVVYEESGQKEPKQLEAIPIDLGEQEGARAVQKTVELNLKKYAAKNGVELSYEIRVREDRGTDQPRVASRPSASGKNSKQKQTQMAQDQNKGKSASQPKASPSAPAASNNAVATANAANRASPSGAENSQAPSNASAANNSNDATSSPQPQEKSTQPQASALAANENPKSTNLTSKEQPQSTDKAIAASQTKPAAPNSASTDKNAALAKADPQTPSAAETKNPSEPTSPRTASSGLQTLANNAKPGNEQSMKSQPADASPTANPNTARDTAATKKQQETNPQQPAGGAAQLAKAETPKAGTTSQSKNPAEPPAPRTASQALANNAKPNNEQSKSQPAGASPTAKLDAAKDAAVAMKQQQSNPQSPASGAPQLAKSEMKKDAASQTKNPAEAPVPRTATSGRRSLASDSSPANSAEQSPDAQQPNASQTANSDTSKNTEGMKKDQPADQKPAATDTAKGTKEESKSENMAAAANQSKPSSNSNPQKSDSSKTAASQSTPPPGDNMPKRTLDVQPPPQSASSQRMRLKVDQWAGSFEGQQRAKLEMAIAPELEALDQKLAKAQRTSRGVLDGLDADHTWMAAYDRDVASSQQLVVDGQAIIDKLVTQSKETPYAFIGLQVADLGVAHVEPARTSFWSAIQSKGDDRTASVRDGWQHLGRARQLLADLRGQFERSKREFQLAEAVERAKKMYQVYVENSQALLQTQENDPDRYNRKMAEFNLDDEYLKRLKEVIKMRLELQAELARILAEDPRLLRRYMDNVRARSNNLREQLADLSAKQEGLNREVRAWAAFPEADRQPMAKLLLLQNLQESSKVATAAGELQDRYQSWLPLQKESNDAQLVAVGKQMQAVATFAGDLKSRADTYIATEQQAALGPAAAVAPPAATTEAAAVPAKPLAAAEGGVPALDAILTQSQSLYSQLGQLEVSLRQLASREDQTEVAQFAANRLVQTRRLITDTSAWIRQIQAQKAGSYAGAAEVTQYRLALKTDELAGKLANLERQLSAELQQQDGKLPETIAAKSREFMAALDKEAAPNQLAAVYALHSNQLPRTTERQQAAGTALVKAEKLYDELMRLTIAELDKLPVQDPIASLLDDPTLDELLAQLEQEASFEELLGIPNRPSNLRIIGDWLRPGNQGGGGGMQRITLNQMQQKDKQSQAKLKQAYQRAIARALKETAPKRTEQVAKSAKLSDWNKLVSHLGNDLKQGRDKAPPEQYRQAIEQYFAQISRVVAEQEKKAP